MPLNYPVKSVGRRLIQSLIPLVNLQKGVLLIGKHGIGKSQILSQVAEQLGVEYSMIDLSTMDPTDLQGIPKVTDDSLRYFRTNLLPREGRGLLCLEELNRCPNYMRQPVLNLLTARRLNDYVLPDGWSVAASINPTDADYEVDEMCPALLSRFAVFNVVANRREWLKWAKTAGIHKHVCSYVESDQDIFSQPDSNPRAWHNVSDILHACEKEAIRRQESRNLVASYIGITRARALFSFVFTPEKPLSVDDILVHFARHRSTVAGWIATGKIDFLNASLSNLLVYLQPKKHVASVTQDQAKWRNVGRFLADLPGDMREKAQQHFKSHGHSMPRTGK